MGGVGAGRPSAWIRRSVSAEGGGRLRSLGFSASHVVELRLVAAPRQPRPELPGGAVRRAPDALVPGLLCPRPNGAPAEDPLEASTRGKAWQPERRGGVAKHVGHGGPHKFAR